MSKLELGKWYTYDRGRDTSYTSWNTLPLSIYDSNVFSIDVEIKASEPKISLEEDGLSWFDEQMDIGRLNLSTDPPSFSGIPLSYEQKTTIFNTIFRMKE